MTLQQLKYVITVADTGTITETANRLEFHQLFVARPHVFISRKHPLAGNSIITNEELEEYPYLSFEQGEHNSFYFSEKRM